MLARGDETAEQVRGELLRFSAARDAAHWSRWRALSADAPPFLLPEFFALTTGLAEGEPLVVLASDPGGVVGALPLLRSGRRLRALRSEHTPGYDYLGTHAGLAAIWAALGREAAWDELFLEAIPVGSLAATRLPELARDRRCPVIVVGAPPQRWFALRGFEASLDSRFRMNLGRTERKAGGTELERIASPTRADLADAYRIEALAWKGAAGTDIGSDPRLGHFYGALARLLGGRGRGSLYFLRIGGRRVATVLAVEDARTLYALKTGYDPQYASVGPGHLIFWKIAQEAERRGLEELHFLGRDAEWKRRWTDATREFVSVRIYRRSARGLAVYALREVVKPRLPEPMRDLRTPLRRGCQRDAVIGVHGWLERVRGRLGQGLGIRSGIRRALAGPPPPRDPLGPASRFAEGEWVRVLDAEAIRATLDAGSRLRGLRFIAQMWPSCGHVLRVQKQVRRMRDDHGRYRPVARTVLLAGETCAGGGPEPTGCGRRCPSMYRDEWLEPAPRPRLEPPAAATGPFARVRGADEIIAGLDLRGRRDGLPFMPQMAGYAGQRFRVLERLRKVHEYDRWVDPRAPVYVLEGLHCGGVVPGEDGPCDRACTLLWHGDWLLLEAAPPKER
jgi:CelD/BcsL family acetyltransferase involved in cellulose biosynthesis